MDAYKATKKSPLSASLGDLRENDKFSPPTRIPTDPPVKRKRSRSKKRRSTTDINYADTCIDPGYRSDTSDPDNDVNISPNTSFDDKHKISVKLREKTESNSQVTKLKRSISGKFRSSNKVLDNSPPPKDDSIHKNLISGITTKQFLKYIRKANHIDQVNGKGQSMLHVCVSRNLIECTKILIKRGCNVNLQDNVGYTPLHCAATEKNLECCQLLLETKNIDVTIVNNENSNVLHYLVRITVDEDNLIMYRRILDLLIENGINVNAGNKHNEAPIHSACLKNNFHAVAFLLERGADCNYKTNLNETPLFYAIRVGSIKLVRILLENGADPTLQIEDGTTPVDVAQQYQCTEILDCLQSIIEEELHNYNNLSLPSPRVRINESTIVKEGILYVLWNGDWVNFYVILNLHRVICKSAKDDPREICQISLNNSTVKLEDGTIMDGGRLLFCCSICEMGENFLSLASEVHTVLDKWVLAINIVINNRNRLYDIYEKLKELSIPRLRLRKKERNIAINNCKNGVIQLKSFNQPKLLCTFLYEKDVLASAALYKIMKMDNDSIFTSLTKYLIHKEKFEDFLKAAITHEIAISATGETLFREMSLCTRLLSTYLDIGYGKEYLKTFIPNLLNDLSNCTNENIVIIAQNLLNQILSSPNIFPVIFREILKHTKDRVDRIYPNMTHAVVGGFVFLRFICPSIISPYQFGLTKNSTHPNIKDAVLITKLLQTVSNGVEFDESKDVKMRQFNSFIKKNRLCVNVFFDSLTNNENIIKHKQKYVLPKKLGKDEIEHLEKTIYTYIISYKDKIDDIVSGKERICAPILLDSEDFEDENSAVEMEDI